MSQCQTGGVIILGGTPIGNLSDASARLRETLESIPVIASEDTRTTIKLLAGLGIENRPRLIALHDHNESAVSAEVVELAREADVLVLSDAGMPTVSDPGYHLVQAAPPDSDLLYFAFVNYTTLGYGDVILPHETRRRICRSLVMLRDKKIENPWRKHGNIPL